MNANPAKGRRETAEMPPVPRAAGEVGSIKTAIKEPDPKEWAFLAYIAGDNDLSDRSLEDINDMCKCGSSRNTYAAVQIDTKGEFDGSIQYEISEPDWTGKAHRCVIERLPESDSGTPKTLRDFLKWGIGRYPANNRLVVIWGHGWGLIKGIAADDSGSSLDMPQLRRVFRRVKIGSELPRITILGFDACLMSMLEIAHHFRGIASIIVGSEQTEPGDGWPYGEVLKSCTNAKSPEILARSIVEAYIKDCRRKKFTEVTQSAIDTAQTDRAMKALSELGYKLKNAGDEALAAVRTKRSKMLSFDETSYVDAVDMAKKVGDSVADPKVKQAADVFQKAIEDCVIQSENHGREAKKAKGLSIWFPADRNKYCHFRPNYIAMDFWKNRKGWVRFLDKYHAT